MTIILFRYENLRKLDINQQESLFSKGSTLLKIGNISDGLTLMLKAAELSDRPEKDFPYFFFWISEAFLAKRDYEKSVEWNRRGLDLFPTDEFLSKQKVRIGLKETLLTYEVK